MMKSRRKRISKAVGIQRINVFVRLSGDPVQCFFLQNGLDDTHYRINEWYPDIDFYGFLQ